MIYEEQEHTTHKHIAIKFPKNRLYKYRLLLVYFKILKVGLKMLSANDINIAAPTISIPKRTAFKGVTMPQRESYEPPSDGGTKILLGLTAVAASVIAGLALHKSVKLGKVAEELKVTQSETKTEVQKLSQKLAAEPAVQAPAAIPTQTEQVIKSSTTTTENTGEKLYIPKHELGSGIEGDTSAISSETQNLYVPKHESVPLLEESAPLIEAEIPSAAQEAKATTEKIPLPVKAETTSLASAVETVTEEIAPITLIEHLKSDLILAKSSLNEAEFSYSIAKNCAAKDPGGFKKATKDLEAAQAKVKGLEDKISAHDKAQTRLSETTTNLRDANFNLQIAQNCETSKPGAVRKAQIDLRLAQAQHGRAKAQVARFNRPVNQ